MTNTGTRDDDSSSKNCLENCPKKVDFLKWVFSCFKEAETEVGQREPSSVRPLRPRQPRKPWLQRPLQNLVLIPNTELRLLLPQLHHLDREVCVFVFNWGGVDGL